jgi:rare lipoprotein A
MHKLRSISRIILGSILLGTLIFPATASTNDEGFIDVPETHRYAKSIQQLSEDGIIQGFPVGTFLPDRTINRVETLKIIIESFGAPNESRGETDFEMPDFEDVDADAWYYEYIEAAVEQNIVKGYDDNTFKPGNTINLAEALKMIVEAVDTDDQIHGTTVEIDPSLDVTTEQWFAKYFQYGLNESMVYIDAYDNLNPATEVTRGQLTDLIYRLKHPSHYSGQVYHGNMTYYADKFHGRTTANGEVFDQTLMTAAHRTLPFGTMLRVTNRWTGDSVEVKVNDRGPYNDHAIIDLSREAFATIGRLSSGIIAVEIEILYSEDPL